MQLNLHYCFSTIVSLAMAASLGSGSAYAQDSATKAAPERSVSLPTGRLLAKVSKKRKARKAKAAKARQITSEAVPPGKDAALAAQIMRLNRLEREYASARSLGAIRVLEIVGYVTTGLAVIGGITAFAVASNEGDCDDFGFDECGPPVAILSAMGMVGLGLAIPMTVIRKSRNREAAELQEQIDTLEAQIERQASVNPGLMQLSLGPASAQLTLRF